jgi:hypothetical protein
MQESKTWCNMPSVQGTIGGTHINVVKPFESF